MTVTTEMLTRRLDRLEREARWWRRGVALTLLGGVALGVMGQIRPSDVARVIEAEKFVLRGPDGHVRAELVVETDGDVELRLLGDQGKTAMAVLATGTQGPPRLALADDNGKLRAVLGHVPLRMSTGEVEHRPASSLVLLDKDSRLIWKAP
jgi:hypothetical protein